MIFNATDPGNPDATTTEKPDEVNPTVKPDDGSNSTEIPNSCILPQLFWAIVLAMVYSNRHM